MIRNELPQMSLILTILEDKKSILKKKPPSRSLRNFCYELIYNSLWNPDLFDVALKKTDKKISLPT